MLFTQGWKCYMYPFDHDRINSECKFYTTYYNSQRLKHLLSNPQLSLHPVDLTIWLTIFPQSNQETISVVDIFIIFLSFLVFICQIMT